MKLVEVKAVHFVLRERERSSLFFSFQICVLFSAGYFSLYFPFILCRNIISAHVINNDLHSPQYNQDYYYFH